MKKLIATSLLLGTLLNPFLENAMAKKIQQSFTGEFVTGYESRTVNSVKNMPFNIRRVPNLPKDYRLTVIEDSPINLYGRGSLGAKFGNKISFYDLIKFTYGIGIDLKLNLSNDNGVDRKDVNQKKSNESYKPTLSCEGPTEYDYAPYNCVYPSFFSKKNTRLRPNVYSEIGAKITEHIALALGCELSKEKIIVENGWADYQNLHKRGRYNLVDLTIGKPYISLKIYNLKDEKTLYSCSFDTGMTKLLKKRFTDIGKQTYIDFNNTGIFINFRLGTNF